MIKNKIQLSLLLHKNSKKFNILFLGIIFFIFLLISIYYSTTNNFLNNDIKEYIFYHYLITHPKNNDTLEETITYISNQENIIQVTPFYEFQNILYSNELITNNLDGSIQVLSANNDMLPPITKGTNFPQDSINDIAYMICPENFYPTNLMDLNKLSINDKIKDDLYLNKELTFHYTSNYEKYNFQKKFKIIGTYQNNKNHFDENICFVEQKVLSEIALNQYLDDFDKTTNQNNIILQDGIVIYVDEIENIDSVQKFLVNNGYVVNPMTTIDENYFNEIKKNCMIYIVIAFIVVIVFLFIVFEKQYEEDKSKYKLLRFLGYNIKDIFSIMLIGNIAISIFTILTAIFITSLLIIIPIILFLKFPFILNKWAISYDPKYIIFLILILIVFNLLFLIMKWKREKFDKNV